MTGTVLGTTMKNLTRIITQTLHRQLTNKKKNHFNESLFRLKNYVKNTLNIYTKSTFLPGKNFHNSFHHHMILLEKK